MFTAPSLSPSETSIRYTLPLFSEQDDNINKLTNIIMIAHAVLFIASNLR